MPSTSLPHVPVRCVSARAPWCGAPAAAPASAVSAGRCWRLRPATTLLPRSPCGRSLGACTRRSQPRWVAAAKDDTSGQEEAELVQMDADEKMEKSLESVKRNFGTVRTGRANTAILDRIMVDYYGVMTPLKKMANASTPDAQTITIQPFDKTTIKDIERAINTSDLGIAPSNDGNIIRLNVPPLTQERRKEMTKQVGKLAEEGKVALRNVRRDALKALEKLEKDKLLSEDQLEAAKEAMQKAIDKATKQVEDLAEAKTKELMQV